jgi:purine-binding chemotaxis protein CheW
MTDKSPIWEPSAEEVLKRRAEQLAKLPHATDAGDEVEVLVCRLGGERYAVETRHLRAVQWTSGITPVPCTPKFVVGIVSVRGEIVTLLDLASMIGLQAVAAKEGEACPALLLGLPGLRSGLVVDEVLGVERYKLNNLQPSLSGREFARGVEIKSNTVLLDLELLFGSGRFTISDEA